MTSRGAGTLRSCGSPPKTCDDPIALALAIAEALQGRGVPHALYGGLLLAAYGEARETRGVDIAVARLAGTTPEHDIAARWRRVLIGRS